MGLVTPQLLAEYLTVLRKQGARAFKMDKEGAIAVEFGPELLPEDMVQTSEEAQLRWGRPFDMDDPRSER